MDDIVSLKRIYEIIDLCKYARVDGKEMEIIVNSVLPNQREITIGIKNSLYDRYTFSFEDGDSFDKDFLPKLLDYFIKDDDVLSCTVTDPSIKEVTVKSLMQTKDGNDFLIQSYKKDDFLKKFRDKINELNQNDLNEDKTLDSEYTELERMAGVVLKYISGRKTVKDYLVNIGEGRLKEAIDLVYDIYKENGNKSLSNEELKEKIKEKKNKKNTSVCNLLISDLELPTHFLTNGIKNFIRNEEKYKKYKEDALFQKCKRIGIKLLNDGYFEHNLIFPKGADIIKLNSEELDKLTTKKANSRYYILLNERENYLKNNDLESVKIVDDGFISYLKKTRTRKNLKNNLDMNELKVTETTNIKKSIGLLDLQETIDLYRDGKKDDEKLRIEINGSNIYIGITNGLSRDSDNYTIDSLNVKKVVEYLLLRDYSVKEETNNSITISCKDNVEIVIPSTYKDMLNKDENSLIFDENVKMFEKEMNKLPAVNNDKAKTEINGFTDTFGAENKDVKQLQNNTVENKMALESDENIIEHIEDEESKLTNDSLILKLISNQILKYFNTIKIITSDNNITSEQKKEKLAKMYKEYIYYNRNDDLLNYIKFFEKLRKYKEEGKIKEEYYESKIEKYKKILGELSTGLGSNEKINEIKSEDITKSIEEEIKKLPNISRHIRTSTRYLRDLMLINNNILSKEKRDEKIKDFERVSLINPYIEVYEKLRKYKDDGKVNIDFYNAKLGEFKDKILSINESLLKKENSVNSDESYENVNDNNIDSSKDNDKVDNSSSIISELNKTKENKKQDFVSLNSAIGTDNITQIETAEGTLGYEDTLFNQENDTSKKDAGKDSLEKNSIGLNDSYLSNVKDTSLKEKEKDSKDNNIENNKTQIPNTRPREVDPEYKVEVVRGRVSDEKVDARLKEIEERRKNREFSRKILMEILKEDVNNLEKEKSKDALKQMKDTLLQIEKIQREDEIDKARSL